MSVKQLWKCNVSIITICLNICMFKEGLKTSPGNYIPIWRKIAWGGEGERAVPSEWMTISSPLCFFPILQMLKSHNRSVGLATCGGVRRKTVRLAFWGCEHCILFQPSISIIPWLFPPARSQIEVPEHWAVASASGRDMLAILGKSSYWVNQLQSMEPWPFTAIEDLAHFT